jgi:hypothetical protein
VFTPEVLHLLRAQLTMLANDLGMEHLNVNQLYGQIVGCFMVYGAQRQRSSSSLSSEQWMSFLSEDEKDVRS